MSGIIPYYIVLFLAVTHSGIAAVFLLFFIILSVSFKLKNTSHSIVHPYIYLTSLYYVYFGFNDYLLSDFSSYDAFLANLPILLCPLLLLCKTHQVQENQKFLDIGILVLFLGIVLFRSNCDYFINIARVTGCSSRLLLYARNPLIFANMIAGLGVLSLVFYDPSKKINLVPIVIKMLAQIAVVIIILAFSQARSATISYFVAAILWATLTFLPQIKYKKSAIALMSSVTGLSIYFFIKFSGYADRYVAGIKQIYFSDIMVEASMFRRLEMWRGGWKAFLDSPIFGYGFSNRFDAAEPYSSTLIAGHGGQLHNAYINHLVAGGVFGFILLLIVTWYPLYHIITTSRDRNLKNGIIVFSIMVVTICLVGSIWSHWANNVFWMTIFIIMLKRDKQVKSS